jgi:hypothetical protein
VVAALLLGARRRTRPVAQVPCQPGTGRPRARRATNARRDPALTSLAGRRPGACDSRRSSQRYVRSVRIAATVNPRQGRIHGIRSAERRRAPPLTGDNARLSPSPPTAQQGRGVPGRSRRRSRRSSPSCGWSAIALTVTGFVR